MSHLRTLQNAIQEAHGCDSTWVRSFAVQAKLHDKASWEGTVELFKIVHPVAAYCYAWTFSQGLAENRVAVVLGIAPVYSARTAVEAYFAQEPRYLPQETAP